MYQGDGGAIKSNTFGAMTLNNNNNNKNDAEVHNTLSGQSPSG